jgi:hypothetical protein
LRLIDVTFDERELASAQLSTHTLVLVVECAPGAGQVEVSDLTG